MPVPIIVPATMEMECQTFSSRTSSGLCVFTADAGDAMVNSSGFAIRGLGSMLHCRAIGRRAVSQLRQLPVLAQLLVLGFRQLDQQRIAGGIKPAEQRLKLFLWHGRAAHRGLA